LGTKGAFGRSFFVRAIQGEPRMRWPTPSSGRRGWRSRSPRAVSSSRLRWLPGRSASCATSAWFVDRQFQNRLLLA